MGKQSDGARLRRERRPGMKKSVFIGLLLLLIGMGSNAQQYTGLAGLIHTPSAEMEESGTAKIGGYFLNREFTPDAFTFRGKYHTADYFLSLTPFSWIELAYTCTLQKNYRRDGHSNIINDGSTRYYYQDRYFSVKIRVLPEGKWWPAIAIGSNDPIGTVDGSGNSGGDTQTGDGKSQYFCNYYVAASKHFQTKGHELALHVAYRKYKRDYNRKWNGIVGGLTYRPSFAKDLRAIVEYTGNDVNIGVDCLLWRHLFLQASLQNGKYFTGGICFKMNLLGKKKTSN